MANRPEFVRTLDFILGQATNDELIALKSAVEQRVRGAGGASAMDFQEMSRDIMRQFSGKFGIGTDMHKMTRNVVARMVRTHEPDIPDSQLNALLDQWVPDPQKAARGKEAELPADALLRMVQQFVDYATGRMKDTEQRELKEVMGDWPAKYWDIFSIKTRALISELVRGQMSEKDFWGELQRSWNTPG